MRAVSRVKMLAVRNMTLSFIDECEGCQVHNLWCEKGTGRLHGFQCDGHFAEYSVADSRNAMVLPEGMDMVTAAPLFCAGVTGKCPILSFYHLA